MLLIVVMAGCTKPIVHEEALPQPTPREKASDQLTREGRQLLNEGKLDNAIRLFEQAVGIDPNNGQCYFYLAQAWLQKGIYSEAREFNDLARIYLNDDRHWMTRVQEQADQIKRLEQSD